VPDSKLDLLLESVVSVLHRLAGMPTSAEVRGLADRALECERKIRAWDQQPPTSVEREAMMKLVLGLHMTVAKLH
jgi:hypothetical protein